MNKQLLVLVIPAMMLGCSKDNQTNSKNGPVGQVLSTFGFDTADQNIIQITDANQVAIPGAKVLIGNAQNDVFAGNFLQADDQGQVAVPSAWTTAANVTVDAPGYVRQTFLNQSPRGLKFVLRKLQVEAKLELSGVAKNLPIVEKDNFVDFGVVMPAMTRQDLLAFDIGKVISPITDKITLVGNDIFIPSNVSLPTQHERYFFNLTLEKPTYKIYFREPGVQRVYAARGRFVFDRVVDKMRNGDAFNTLINDFQITGGAIRDITIAGGKTVLDFPMMELNYVDKMSMQAPNMGKDQVMLAVTAADMNGLLIPTDVKQITSAQKVNLSVMTGQNSVQVAVLKNQSEFDPAVPGADRLSAVIGPAMMNFAPQFLPLIANPSLDKLGNVVFPRPNTIAGINPVATYSILSDVVIKGSGDSETKLVKNVWEIYSDTWIDRAALPKWPTADVEDATKRRWEVTFIGSQTTNKAELGPKLLDSATHVTHSSFDF